MSKFYGNMAYVGCGNGCNSKMQKVILDEQDQPVDIDWDGLQQVYNQHNLTCTTDSLFTNDDNAFYGNPEECTGFVIEGNSESGYKYCEF